VTAAGPRVGTPASFRLVTAYLASGSLCWLAATVALLRAGRDLRAGAFETPAVLRCVHLTVLGALPLAVAGAVLHLGPVLLRNGRPGWRAWVALPCLWAGPVVASGIADFDERRTTVSAGVLATGLALLVWELTLLVVRAPATRMLLVSRLGVALSALGSVLALALGVALARRSWRPLAGVPHDRLMAIHLTLGLLGWLTLLIVAVGRTLASMLALAPAEPKRSAPVAEAVFAGGLAVAIGGLAAGSAWLTAVGAVVLAAVLARFGVLLARVARENRLERPEGPLVHFLIGILCLTEAAAVIGVLLAGDRSPRLQELAVGLVLGWATGVTLGHMGKLLAVSAWTWWPPGPRPKQAAFYPRTVWIAEAAAFGIGIQLVAAGILGAWQAPLTAGAGLLVAGGVLAVAGCLRTVAVSVPSLRLGGHA
jgi:hypothetical protein